MITALAIACCAAWIYLIGFRGFFWRSGPVLPAAGPGGASVAVIVPARNEAETIRRCLQSLLAQSYAGSLGIILVDDNSSDGTGAMARELAADPRLMVRAGEPLPPGWSGKMWAVHQGLQHASERNPEYVLLTDADVVHDAGHVAALVAKAEAQGLDLVSEMVRLHCRTLPERALIPAFVFFFQMLYPFAWVCDGEKSTAGAAGGTMLVRTAALDRIGGVTRIRAALIDDCALAKEMKSSGGRMWLGHAEQAASLRAYAGWREVWNMIARTAYVQLRYSPLLLAGCIASMIFMFALPPALSFLAHGIARLLGVVSWCAMALAFQPTLRRYRCSPVWGVALPAIAMFYMGATAASAFRHYAGRGGGWKDRVYPSGGAGSAQ